MSQPAETSLEYFLAHALVLETETVERLEDVVEMMRMHGNLALAELFARLAAEGQSHVEQIRAEAAGVTLPALKPWEFHWPGGEPPEVLDIHELHYLHTPVHALEYAMACEMRAHEYYAQVADASGSEEVTALANLFAEEELSHYERIRKWAAGEDEPSKDHDLDIDPPHMPA